MKFCKITPMTIFTVLLVLLVLPMLFVVSTAVPTKLLIGVPLMLGGSIIIALALLTTPDIAKLIIGIMCSMIIVAEAYAMSEVGGTFNFATLMLALFIMILELNFEIFSKSFYFDNKLKQGVA